MCGWSQESKSPVPGFFCVESMIPSLLIFLFLCCSWLRPNFPSDPPPALISIDHEWSEQRLPPLKIFMGTSLAVQWLRFYASTVGGKDSIPVWDTKIPSATWCGTKKFFLCLEI